MTRHAPLVEGTTLLDQDSGGPPIELGTVAWQRWLQQATSFAFHGASGRFTARKERRGRADGYWRAYRKLGGKLYSAYLGQSADLALERLESVARTLADMAPAAQPANRQLTHTPRPPDEQAPLSGTLTLLLADVDPIIGQHPIPEVARERLVIMLSEAIRAAGGATFVAAATLIAGSFGSPIDAVDAALTIRRTLAAADLTLPWSGALRVALHTGVATAQNNDHHRQLAHWAARLLASGHGGQILLSHVSGVLIGAQLPPDSSLYDLGAYSFGAGDQPARLFQLVGPGMPISVASLRPPARRPHNLPLPATELVGRERDVAAVKAALQQAAARLLTLVGPGGVGKTRLALQVAGELRDSFADGAFLVDLAAVSDPALVIPTISRTLGLGEPGEQAAPGRLEAYLAGKQLLLLLDNFEQLLAAAPAIAALLAAAPGLKLLVTSRAALQLAGEREYPVSPLDHQARGSAAAVTLFVQRAQAVKPDFALSEATAPLVAEITQRLDGLPLAIELAAAQIKLFSPAALLQRLQQPLSLLRGRARDLPERQQTMRSTSEWSYRLLGTTAQAIFRRIAVFVGGFSLEAAAALGVEVDGLAVLVEQSLLTAGEDTAGDPRFTMLGTIHEYALELLEQGGEAPLLRRQHAHYYLRLAEQAEPELTSHHARLWLDRLEADLPNLRTALGWASGAGEAELAARLAAALAVFWDLRGDQREGQRWLEAVQVSGAALAPGLRARLLRALGYLAQARFDRGAAVARFAASLALYSEMGDSRGRAAVLTELGWAYAALGSDSERAASLLEEGLRLYRSLGDRNGIAQALQGLGWVEQLRAFAFQRGMQLAFTKAALVQQPQHLVRARALYGESLALRRATGDARGIAWLLQSLGYIAGAEEQYEQARAFQEERLQLERSLGNRHGMASAYLELGRIARGQGDSTAARAWLVESLALARMVSNAHLTALALLQLGELAHGAADLSAAASLLREALDYLRALDDTHRSAGAIALLAQVLLEGRRDRAAMALAHEALALAQQIASPEIAITLLQGLADSAARRGDWAWAAQLWGAAQAAAASSHGNSAVPPERTRLVAAARAAGGGQPFAAAWASGKLLSLNAALTPPEAAAAQLVGDSSAPPAGLTRRELELLRLLSTGLSNAQIASRMMVATGTVRAYLSVIYSKIGVSSRAAAISYVFEHGLHSGGDRV